MFNETNNSIIAEIEVEETIYLGLPKETIDFVSRAKDILFASRDMENAIGETYESPRYGKYTIIGDEPPKVYDGKNIRMVKVKFLVTGTERIIRLDMARRGQAKDPYAKTIAGIGYIGEVEEGSYDKREYDVWRQLILRCYDPCSNMYRFYGAVGVKVDPRWHCFANFLEDIRKLPGYDKFKYAGSTYQIDKDFLQTDKSSHQKIYGPNTCVFMPGTDNARLATKIHKDTTSSEYSGLYRLENGNFQCRIMVNGEDCFLGTYSNEIAAANMYNHVASGCVGLNILMNNVEYMPLTECLKYKTARYPIKLPTGCKVTGIATYNNSLNTYLGVKYRNKECTGNPMCQFQFNKHKYYYGSFDSPIAAANAYNWYASHVDPSIPLNKLNDDQIMQPDEWLKHKCYNNASPAPKRMVRFFGESDSVRDARCMKTFGMTFQ